MRNSDTYIFERKGVWYFRQAVPMKVRAVIKRKQIWKSLRTKDKKKALVNAGPLIAYYFELFNRPHDQLNKEQITLNQVQLAAKAYDFQYRPHSETAAASVSDAILMLRDGLSVIEKLRAPDIVMTAAIAGAIAPTLSLDAMLDRFWELADDKLMDRDSRNAKNSKNRYQSAASDFKEIVGDIDVLKIDSKQAFEYARKLTSLIKEKKLKIDTAKHKIRYLRAAIQKVFNSDFPEKKNPFEKVKIEYSGDEGKRKPLTDAEVSQVYSEMERSNSNNEIVSILNIMEKTGCNAKEICLLHKDDIHLDAPIPYISIRANANRKHLKTTGARHRDIPLIGTALEAAKRFPKGFPSYCRDGGSDAFSAAVNKHIKKVARGKTSYGYRHRMADLLRASSAQDSLIGAILGHGGGMTDHYGEGHNLDKKMAALSKAFEGK